MAVNTFKRIVSALLRPKLIPVHPGKQLVPASQGAAEWVAIGNDPGFIITPSLATPLVRGWYMLECQADHITGLLLKRRRCC